MHPHDTKAVYEAEAKSWKAMGGLADLYLQCGWDVNAVAQTQFRSSEFLDMRAEYVREVLQPLEGTHERLELNYGLDSNAIAFKTNLSNTRA